MREIMRAHNRIIPRSLIKKLPSRCLMRILAVTNYHALLTVTENHLRFVLRRYIRIVDTFGVSYTRLLNYMIGTSLLISQ